MIWYGPLRLEPGGLRAVIDCLHSYPSDMAMYFLLPRTGEDEVFRAEQAAAILTADPARAKDG